MPPEWTQHLTEDDEWPVRTALTNVVSDLEKALSSMPNDLRSPARRAISDSIRRYKDTIDRVDGVHEIRRV